MNILIETLRLIASAEVRQPQDLAARLGITVELVDGVLQDLVRGGYLTAVASACHQSCGARCGRATCSSASIARVWVLTDRGKRVAGPMAS